jgi:2-dehydro-3-deoxyphosphogluconate aldolase/(4S)-4-hydroxy-2-oxoglutarate aldolase
MVDRPAIPHEITEGRILAIARNVDRVRALALGWALAEAGIRTFEVTLQGPAALDAIASARFELRERLLIGAGTVLDVHAARQAIDAGAAFLVTPIVDLDVIGWAAAHDIPVLAGAYTPTEILTAWRAGAAAVKLFPASVGGPSLVRELRGPLPDIPLVPTGGVSAENAPAFLSAGAIAVGVGSWLTGSRDIAVVRERAAQLVRVVSD